MNLGPQFGAVDERIAEPPVGRIGQLGQAVGAGRGVGRHKCPPLAARLARRDRERGRAVRGHGGGGDPLDPRQRRRVPGQRLQERRDRAPAVPRPPRTPRRTSLPTRPPRPRPVASEYTNGRNPTPWTIPSTRTAVLIRWLMPPIVPQSLPDMRFNAPVSRCPWPPERSARPSAGAQGGDLVAGSAPGIPTSARRSPAARRSGGPPKRRCSPAATRCTSGCAGRSTRPAT